MPLAKQPKLNAAACEEQHNDPDGPYYVQPFEVITVEASILESQLEQLDGILATIQKRHGRCKRKNC